MTSREVAVDRAALPDLVYPVRDGENEELRYSLRSVAANAHGLYRKVWVVGRALPDWLTNVEKVNAGVDGGKLVDVPAKLVAICANDRVADRFVFMMDDCYLVERIDEWPAFHMGPTSEYVEMLAGWDPPVTLNNSAWLRIVVSTAEWMAEQGYPDILARQGHRPLLWDRRKLATALDMVPAGREFDVVGLYDLAGAGGVGRQVRNSKITADPAEFHRKLADLDTWLSSNDRSFREGMIGGFIRGMFRDPSRYEKEAA